MGWTPRRVLILLWSLVAILTVASVFAQFAIYSEGSTGALPTLFDSVQERNVPTAFSAVALVGCAVLLALRTVRAWRSGEATATRWGVLTLLFVYAAVDESISIHELADAPLRSMVDTGGIFYFPLLIPAAAAVAGLSVYLAPLLRSVRPGVSPLLVSAGALWIGGAVVGEMVEGLILDTYSVEGLWLGIEQVVAEALEMLGATTLIYALLLELNFGGQPVKGGFEADRWAPHEARYSDASRTIKPG